MQRNVLKPVMAVTTLTVYVILDVSPDGKVISAPNKMVCCRYYIFLKLRRVKITFHREIVS